MLRLLVTAEQDHGEAFGARLEVVKMEVTLACLLNQAACALKMAAPDRAVDNCTAVLTFDPEHAKAGLDEGLPSLCLPRPRLYGESL